MKKNIHPAYSTKANITCACGAVFSAGSTDKDIRVEICSQCHPFYTGKSKLVDTAGRVDKFKARMEASKKMKEAAAAKKEKPNKKTEKTPVNSDKTVKIEAEEKNTAKEK